MTAREALDGLFAAWESGDALRAVAHFAPGSTYREARRDPIVGREAILAHFTRFFRDGPRWRFVPQETTIEGERAAVAYSFGIFEEGKGWTEHHGCALVHFRDGAIAEWREYEG
jgi:ketosteroid isomerase-like protein